MKLCGRGHYHSLQSLCAVVFSITWPASLSGTYEHDPTEGKHINDASFDVWSNWYVTPVIFSLFWIMFFTRSYRRSPERTIRQWLATGQNAIVLSPRTVAISDAEVVETVGAQTTQVRWDGVAEIVRNDRYMLIVLNPERAITVPKRVFASADAAEQFYTAALSYHNQARQRHEASA